jgi:predicted ATPase
MLFGSRGLVDLIRGVSDRKKRGKDDSPSIQESIAPVTSKVEEPSNNGRPLSPVAEVTAIPTTANFVGRQRELGTLKSALEDAAAGRGRVVMLAGEPGIGKTRMVEELAAYAASTGSQVLWGRCYEDSGAPPYWPWIEVTRARIREIEAGQLRQDMGTGAANVAEIVPEVRAKLPSLANLTDLNPEQARFQLFDAMTSFLVNTSQSQPLVLALEDLHWADTSSLRMLEFLGSRISDSRLMVVGAYRDGEVSPEHPLSQTLGTLSSEPSFRLETLRRFNAEETGSLIEATGGLQPTEGLIQKIQAHTEGNPMFVSEVVRLLDERGELGSAEAGLAVPESVRAVTRQRLRGLSSECNQTLIAASIVGKEFDFSLIKRLFPDTSEGGLSETLHEAARASLVAELPQEPGRYQFSHSLIRQALSEELSVTARTQIHAGIAVALEDQYGDEVATHAAELAYHFAQAKAVIGVEKLVQYSLLAGNAALNVRAYEEALNHFQIGLAAKGVSLTGQEPALEEEAAALLSGLGHAKMGTSDRTNIAQGDEIITRAFDYYVDSGDSDRAVTIALTNVTGTSGHDLVKRALTLVPPDSHDAGRLQARHIIMLRADVDGAQSAFRHALSIAHQQYDQELEMQALVNIACVDHHNCRNALSLERNRQAIELAKLVDLPAQEAHARFDLHNALHTTGELEEAAIHAEAILAPAERTRILTWQVRAMLAIQGVHGARGKWESAKKFLDQGLAMSPQEPVLLGRRALMESQLGESDASEATLARLLDAIPGGWSNLPSTAGLMNTQLMFYAFPAVVIPSIARITGGMDKFDMAEKFARFLLSAPIASADTRYAARVGLALMAVQRGDKASAGELYGDLQPITGTIAPQPTVGPGLAGDRLLGLLSQTMGNLDQAAPHFEDALSFCRKGYRPELAWTCCDYADLLSERDSDGDRTQASSLLDESLAISSELGIRPLIERVTSRQAGLGT